jgi:hypothetical protein
MIMHETESVTEVQRHLSVLFLGEQNGKPERELKSALTMQFKNLGCVDRAYLVRVRYGGGGVSVALAIAGRPGYRDAVVKGVQTVFSAQFVADQYVDVMFPSASVETALSAVCPPFFNSAERTNID